MPIKSVCNAVLEIGKEGGSRGEDTTMIGKESVEDQCNDNAVRLQMQTKVLCVFQSQGLLDGGGVLLKL